MLLGEHAVVYGRPCLVTAVNQRMKATLELTNEPVFQLEAPDVQISSYQKPMSELGNGDPSATLGTGIPKGAKFVEIAVKNFFTRHPGGRRPISKASLFLTKNVGSKDSIASFRSLQNDNFGVKITTTSEFSSQFGFGSSSASTVCVLKALSELTKTNLDNKSLFDLAYKTVLDIQGKGSGFDVAAAIYGGTLYFMAGGKVIEPLNLDSLPLIVGYSGEKADSVTLMNQVAEKARKYPKVIENIYDSIGKLTEQAKAALLSKDLQGLGELMNFDQGLLAALGVSTRKLADMIYSAREAGAYGAKLSGAGGGDCMIALSPEDKIQAVKDSIASAGGQIIDVETNAEGVRIENVG